MGFRLIMRKTFLDLTGLAKTLAIIVVGVLVPVLSSLAWRSQLEDMSLPAQNAWAVGNFFSVSFLRKQSSQFLHPPLSSRTDHL